MDRIDTLLYFVIVMLIAAVPFFEGMVAIPLGIIFGVPTILAIVAGFIGNLLTVLLLILLVDYIRALFKKKRQRSRPSLPPDPEEMSGREEDFAHEQAVEDYGLYGSKRAQRARRLWDKYGLPGLTVLGTGLLSSHLTALLACSFGGNRAHVSFWMTISLALWCIATGAVVHFGVDWLLG